ncbi:MAG: tetratricopeptide repeat protein [Candidatus Cloacimonetes bacterium]|nr:tetratricopeptide repeat protein [Candidatus Cloacimonadota bacterium]
MLNQRYLVFAALAVLLLLGACTSNKVAEAQVEITPVRDPLKLAIEAHNTAVQNITDHQYELAIEESEKAYELYHEVLATAAPEDSVAYKMETMKMNIAASHIELAYDSSELTLYDEALSHYEQALQIYKKHIPLRKSREELDRDILSLYSNMALVARDAGKYEKSLEYYDAILEIEPANDQVLNNKFRILSDNIKDDERAFQVLKTYAEVANTDTAYLLMADSYADKRNFVAAEEAYMKALSLREDADMYARLGNFFRASNQWTKANTYLEKLAATKPDNQTLALVYKQIGQNYQQLGNSAKMAEFLEKAVAIDKDPNTALSLASYYNGQKNWAKVISHSSTVLGSDANNATARMLRGVAYVQQKNYASARTDLERIQNDATYGAQAQGILKNLPK